MCDDSGHRSEIDCMFNSILDSLSLASVEFRGKLKTPFKQIAGWSEICDELHSSARSAFLLWANAWKPRYGELFHIMRTTRAHFRHFVNVKLIDQDTLQINWQINSYNRIKGLFGRK